MQINSQSWNEYLWEFQDYDSNSNSRVGGAALDERWKQYHFIYK